MTLRRVEAVADFRKNSSKDATRRNAATPSRFAEDRQPVTDYLAIPKTSSELRPFVPIGYLPQSTIVASELFTVAGAGAFEFGILTSSMHNAWIRFTCGRLKSDFRYSASIVYNNFPWPEAPTAAHKTAIEAAAQTVLDTRAQFPGSTLADLYDPLAMPPALLKAHHKLDAAVDAAYVAKRSFKTDAERVAFLFERYQQLTSLLPASTPAKRRARRSISA